MIEKLSQIRYFPGKTKKYAFRQEKKESKGDKAGFISLGTFEFSKGKNKVVISNEGTTGYVVVDSVQWLEKN